MDKKKVIELLVKRGFFVSPDFLEYIDKDFDVEEFLRKLEREFHGKPPKFLTKEVILKLKDDKKKTVIKKSVKLEASKAGTNLLYFIKAERREDRGDVIVTKKIKYEERVEIKKKDEEREKVEIITKTERYIGEEIETGVKVLKNYDKPYEPVTVSTWASYFRTRLNKIRKLLKAHRELGTVVSLEHLKKRNSSEEVSVVGLIFEKKILNSGTIKLVLEDPTGRISVVIKKDSDLYEKAKLVIEDSVIGVIGNVKNGVLFPDDIIIPDIPIKQKKQADEEIYVAFTGDMQIGSKQFLRKDWEKFILWLKGKYGDRKQRELAKKVGYLVITGDLVDGVGVYPKQEEELEIKDIYKQYETVQNYLLEIPEHIKIIIIPGNHDVVVRLAEPQPPIPKKYLEELYKMDNVYLLSNPSYFYVHKTSDFSGFLVLAYHGYSFDWLVSNVEYIRNNGGYENPNLIMKYLLMFRHLAPTHGSTVYVPMSKEDPLVIDPVPDIFVTGHIHRASVGSYKGVDLINASCWQGPTPYQIEMGHVPNPSKVILKNLKTGKFHMLDFHGA